MSQEVVCGEQAGGDRSGGLTKELIDSLDDPVDAMELMNQYGLDMDDLEGLDDAKERLRLFAFPSERRSAKTPDQLLIKLRKQDETRRSRLMQIYQEVGDFMTPVYHKISQEPEILKQFNELRRHFGYNRARLERNECPILVSGETSSGKSSLLNLLLQRKLLPESHLCCTAVITKLRYGETVKAVITPREGKPFEVQLSSDATAFDELLEYVHQPLEDRDQEFKYKEVEIFVPYDILKSGIYIVDSPGIGESSSMEQRLTDYMSEEEVFAFIYVIKSDNAGGVSRDRLQRILKALVTKQDSNHTLPFDPRCAIFVCNRWDMVQKDAEKEEKEVKEKIEDTLAKCWVGLDPNSQIFYMCTKKAWHTQQTGYIPDDLAELLAGLEMLVPVGLLRKIQMAHTNLTDYCTKILHISESFLFKSKAEATQLERTQANASRQLSDIAVDHQEMVRRMKQELEKSIKEIREILTSHMNSKAVAKLAGEWEEDDLPALKSNDTWYEFEAKTLEAIRGKLTVMIFRWEKEEKILANTQGTLIHVFDQGFSDLENMLKEAQLVIEGKDVPSQLRFSVGDTLEVEELMEFTKDFHAILLSDMSALKKVAAGVMSPIMLPVVLAKDIFHGMFGGTKSSAEQQQRKTMERYRKNRQQFMQEVFLQVLRSVQSSDNMDSFIRNRLDGASKKIAEIESAIPSALKDEVDLMESLKRDKRGPSTISKIVAPIISFLKKKVHELAEFGNMYAYPTDFEEEDIQTPVRPSKCPALWSKYSFAKLKAGKRPVCIKTKMKHTHHVVLANELEILRKNKSHLKAHIMDYGGLMGRMGEVPQIVFRGPTSTMRTHFNAAQAGNGGHVLERKLEINSPRKKQYLPQIVLALNYLHHKGWIHMELSLDTILLGASGRVYLSNIGYPRRVLSELDDMGETGHISGRVYLAPEVLLGDFYTPASDMYSLGILCWELWFEKPAFSEFRRMSIHEFAAPDHFTNALLKDVLLKPARETPFAGVMKACLLRNAEKRITAKNCIKEVNSIK